MVYFFMVKLSPLHCHLIVNDGAFDVTRTDTGTVSVLNTPEPRLCGSGKDCILAISQGYFEHEWSGL